MEANAGADASRFATELTSASNRKLYSGFETKVLNDFVDRDTILRTIGDCVSAPAS